MDTQAFYDSSYAEHGLSAQRRYPNEELCRFMGRHFFKVPQAERAHIRILEVGCGSAANLWMIAREGFWTYGLDFSGVSLNLAWQTLSDYAPLVRLHEGDMTAMPYEPASFDAVVDVFSSYCLDNARHGLFLDECARILKPGGRFFSYTPSQNSDAFTNRGSAILIDNSTLDGIKRPNSPYFGNDYPFRFTTNLAYARDLEQRGFTVTGNESVSRTYGPAERFEFVVIEAVKL